MFTYLIISGTFFALIVVLHGMRLVCRWPAQIGSFQIPLWASGLAIGLAAGLASWAFTLAFG
ncbi:MAG: hypothetical protein EXR99_12725 [Gemmataceae bacterium]|nr:hypothetical protein [Gemmataceae bacterium]